MPTNPAAEDINRWFKAAGVVGQDEVPSNDGAYWVRFRGGGRWRGAWLEDGWAQVGKDRVSPHLLQWGPPIA